MLDKFKDWLESTVGIAVIGGVLILVLIILIIIIAKSGKSEKGPKKVENKPAKPVKEEKKSEPKKAAKEEVKEEPVKEEPKAETERVTNYHVSQHPDGGWQVKREKATKALKIFKTQAEAIAFAKEKAGNQENNVIVHKKTGQIRKQN